MYYDWMVRDFFKHMVGSAGGHAFVPGTYEWLFLGGAWKRQAESVHGRAVKACDYEREVKGMEPASSGRRFSGRTSPSGGADSARQDPGAGREDRLADEDENPPLPEGARLHPGGKHARPGGVAKALRQLGDDQMVELGYADGKPYLWIITGNGSRALKHLSPQKAEVEDTPPSRWGNGSPEGGRPARTAA